MKKIVLIPDSFKGTMSSIEICEIMADVIGKYEPDAEIVSVSVADGGEGTVDAFLSAIDGERKSVVVKGPYEERISSFYGILPGDIGVIEMAAAAGLPQVGDRLDPSATTTYGVGQLIAHAVEDGCKKIILGLGGSATNDGGCGAAAALGVVFENAQGDAFVPTGGTLKDIARIDNAEALEKLKGVELVVMCDIDNPLCGPNGAAAIFGPQKGATPTMVEELDAGLLHFSEVMKLDLGADVLDLPGSGAAGGMGGGMVGLLGGTLQMGIETVLDTVDFDEMLNDTDLVFTGEGKIDSQSLQGKVVVGVGRRAKKKGVPVVAVVGVIEGDITPVYEEGIAAVFSITRETKPFAEVKGQSKENLARAMDNLMRYYVALAK